MVALKYSDIPAYLHDSSFYQSLANEEESSVIELPEVCYKATDSVEDVAELEHMLHVIKYWGLNSLPLGPIKFCFENLDVAWPVVSAFEDVHPDFATLFQRGDVNKSLAEAIKANKKDEIVHFLAKMSNPHLRGNQAMEAAASVGRLDFIKIMHKLGFDSSNDAILAASYAGHLYCLTYLCENIADTVNGSRCAKAAAESGHVQCLMYLHANYKIPERNVSPKIMACTALGGHLECLKLMCELNYRHNGSVIANAAKGGHLDCLKFLRSIGCEWDNVTMANAAEYGHLCCLQYTVENGCPKEPSSIDRAIRNGHKECARYLLAHGFVPSPFNITNASRQGDIGKIQFLREMGYPWPENYVLQEAVTGGHLACLRYLVESGCKDGCGDSVLFDSAAQAGRLDILQYLHSVGYFPNNNTVSVCIQFGHVSCLQYVLDVADFELSWEHCSEAIEFGQLDCLQFLRERGVPWDEQTIAEALYCNDQTAEKLACFVFATADGCPLPPQSAGKDDICTALMKYPGFTVEHLKRLRDANCPWSAETMRTAAAKSYQDCVQYLVDNGCPYPE